jgi:CBS domain-containing protein
MKISKVMTQKPATCGPADALAAAASIMWHRDCGAIPIVEEENRLVGMITDRDICIAVTSRNARARGIRIADVMTPSPVTCCADENLRDALRLMAEHQIHRLPVTDADGGLVGIVSLTDLVPHVGKGKKAERISRKDLLHALRAITAPHAPAPIADDPVTNILADSTI